MLGIYRQAGICYSSKYVVDKKALAVSVKDKHGIHLVKDSCRG